MKKGLLLDRDGILIKERGEYNYLHEHFIPLKENIPFLKEMQQQGYLLMVVTNQGGIAKGLYTHEDLHLFHQMMINYFHKKGIEFSKIYYCPHHPDISACLCRKPGHLLIQKAISEFNLSPQESIMIGDKPTDIIAAENAGVKGLLVEPNQKLDIQILNQIIKTGN